VCATARWTVLAESGARVQRPLWASTGVKDVAYPDTMYVDELVAHGVVNTMPEATLTAVADHGTITGDTVTTARGTAEDPAAILAAVEQHLPAGTTLDAVTDHLEADGVAKFEASWLDLLATVEAGLAA
jgi:transaldolase